LSRGVLELRIEGLIPDNSAPIICYCGGGSRSALAADNLQKMGYTNVVSLAGGFKSWLDAGLPAEINQSL
jgi:rhodanese-related sulfurtransferase